MKDEKMCYFENFFCFLSLFFQVVQRQRQSESNTTNFWLLNNSQFRSIEMLTLDDCEQLLNVSLSACLSISINFNEIENETTESIEKQPQNKLIVS